jgi:hypothetical protein
VRRILRDWPEDSCIEARSCRRCHALIALKRNAVD